MRHWTCTLFLLLATWLQGQVRINEVQCTRSPNSDGSGAAGDWVELYNAGSKTVDLGGYRLVLNGLTQRLKPDLFVAPKGVCILWCDRASDLGADHVDLRLSRNGGTLLLIAPNGSTVLDLFQWSALPPGVSIGRRTNGAPTWGYFRNPTPGFSNGGSVAVSRVLKQPVISEHAGTLRITSEDPSTALHNTEDGSLPGPGSTRYNGPVHFPRGTVVHARSFAADALPSPCAVITMGLPDTAWALVVAPKDLVGPLGIADVLSGNHARKGPEWQRQAWSQQGGDSKPVGIAIAGSGSRSLPKRNFKLMVRDRFSGEGPLVLPDGTAWKDVVLRADGSPNAFLRNLFMEETARRSGSWVDVQPSFPIPLYLNGRYDGLYRAMPAKGKEWVRSLNAGEDVDVIEGPGALAVSGRNKHYLRMLKALTDGQNSDSLARILDLGSLVEMACFDLWTGRADHDLNVRCWRPRSRGGRWRWVMFDMDQWAPVDDRTVLRMCSASAPETPFLPQLLTGPNTRDRLLARFSALAATTLSADRAKLLADSLYLRYRDAMEQDHTRWKNEMVQPAPEVSYADLLTHIAGRNTALFEQLSRYTGLAQRSIAVRVEPAGAGTVELEDLMLTVSQCEFSVFAGVPLHFSAMAMPGMEFAGWKGKEGEGQELVVAPLRNLRITAMFRPVGVSRHGGLQQGLE
ncbi:MAG: CotH kinase family protein [Flavobacteriales bacterium]|nr:MAG: CotH kinase family protein [Flavobacteriales bacterium]